MTKYDKKITFLTGASGVGKTTLLRSLAKKYASSCYIFHHDGELEVPSLEDMIRQSGSLENWQKEFTYTWIDLILKELRENPGIRKLVIDLGANLQFIQNGFAERSFDDYQIILIDCSDETMVHRLIHDRKEPELITPDMHNWLRYLRNQANEFQVPILKTDNQPLEETAMILEKMLGFI